MSEEKPPKHAHRTRVRKENAERRLQAAERKRQAREEDLQALATYYDEIAAQQAAMEVSSNDAGGAAHQYAIKFDEVCYAAREQIRDLEDSIKLFKQLQKSPPPVEWDLVRLGTEVYARHQKMDAAQQEEVLRQVPELKTIGPSSFVMPVAALIRAQEYNIGDAEEKLMVCLGAHPHINGGDLGDVQQVMSNIELHIYKDINQPGHNFAEQIREPALQQKINDSHNGASPSQ